VFNRFAQKIIDAEFQLDDGKALCSVSVLVMLVTGQLIADLAQVCGHCPGGFSGFCEGSGNARAPEIADQFV